MIPPNSFQTQVIPHAQPCCERGEPTGRRHVCEGVGSGNPIRIRGDRIAGPISGCRAESRSAKTALFSSRSSSAIVLLKTTFHSLFFAKRNRYTYRIYRNGKVVISWIQLYPAYNHFRKLKIPSRFLNLLPVKFSKHRVFASPKVSPIDCINERVCKFPKDRRNSP